MLWSGSALETELQTDIQLSLPPRITQEREKIFHLVFEWNEKAVMGSSVLPRLHLSFEIWFCQRNKMSVSDIHGRHVYIKYHHPFLSSFPMHSLITVSSLWLFSSIAKSKCLNFTGINGVWVCNCTVLKGHVKSLPFTPVVSRRYAGREGRWCQLFSLSWSFYSLSLPYSFGWNGRLLDRENHFIYLPIE